MKMQPKPQPWKPGDATHYINGMAKGDFDLYKTLHMFDRSTERDLLMGDVLYVLKNGIVVDACQPSTSSSHFKYKIESYCPSSSDREVSVVCIPCLKDNTIKILTVMWKDEASKFSGGTNKRLSPMARKKKQLDQMVRREIMKTYRYTECGLDNVEISGISTVIDDAGVEVLHIPSINELHRAISAGIVSHSARMNGKELRFLRTEMGLTQDELAKLVHHERQSVGRWEREEIPIDQAAEVIIRKHAIEKLRLDVDRATTEELSKMCGDTVKGQKIIIDGTDGTDGNNPTRYKAVAAQYVQICQAENVSA